VRFRTDIGKYWTTSKRRTRLETCRHRQSCRNFKKKVRPMMNRVSSKQIEFYALLEQQKREFREDVAEIESAGLEASIIRAEAAIEGSTHRAEALKQQATYSAAAILCITAITRGLLPSGQVLTTLL